MIPFKNGGCEIELSVKVPQQMGHVKEAGLVSPCLKKFFLPFVCDSLNKSPFSLAGEGGTDSLHVGVQTPLHLADAAAAGSRSAAADAGSIAAVQPGRGGV